MTPMPELADYLRQGKVRELITRSFTWSIHDRLPLFQTLLDVCVFTRDIYRSLPPDKENVPPWLSPQLQGLCYSNGSVVEPFVHCRSELPSRIFAMNGWSQLLGTLPHQSPHLLGCYENRYPYLDKDLVEFLLQVPRRQLVEPGRRRVMMRRALKNCVPEQILERKRKAFISRSPLLRLRNAKNKIHDLFAASCLGEQGLVDPRVFLQAFDNELAGDLKWISHLNRTITAELWLQSITMSGRCFQLV